jgi:hypothetical protein
VTAKASQISVPWRGLASCSHSSREGRAMGMELRLVSLAWLAAVVIAGCQAAARPEPQANVAALRDQMRAARQACAEESRQMQASGASPQAIRQRMMSCVGQTTAIMRPYAEQHLAQESNVAVETLHLDEAAQNAAREGRYEDAVAFYRRIDANAPAIKAEVTRKAPAGAVVSGSVNIRGTPASIAQPPSGM